ncbi:MAG: hypothetical protein RL662_2376 [Bacteroidota bacterium]|jgi:hypothetical protein
MKTTLKVTTVVEITGVKTSYEIGEALKKAFKDVAHVNDELTDDDAHGYSFTFHGNPTVDLKALESKVNKICENTWKKELAEEAEAKAQAKKNLEGFTGFVLTPVKNKYAKLMDEVIEDFSQRVLDYIEEKEYSMANATWADTQDFITLRMLLDTKDSVECYKFARNLDTYVRESIPDKVYDYLIQGEV